LIEPITRQKAGSFVKSAGGPPNEGAGDLKAPAATDSTPEIVVLGSASAASSSHDFAVATLALAAGAELFADSGRLHAESAAAAARLSAIDILFMILPQRSSIRLAAVRAAAVSIDRAANLEAAADALSG
jgi:hypothetical protein